MGFTCSSQAMACLGAFLLGLWLGVLYECFRVPRLLFRIPPVAVFLADIVYGFLSAVAVFVFSFLAESGRVRLYVLLAVFAGVAFYILTLGRAVCLIVKKVSLRFRGGFKNKKKEE